jgi:hypothetical protein
VGQNAGIPAADDYQHDVPLRMTGIAVSVVYNPRQLNISWENGSSLTLRFDAVTGKVEVDRPPGGGPVLLRFGVRMNKQAPRGITTGLNVVLPFPETIAAEVERLAERLSQATAPPGHGRPGPVTGQLVHPSAGMPEAQASVRQAAPVRIRAAPAYWADDPGWIGLYPPKDTERLLLASPDGQARRADHPSAG